MGYASEDFPLLRPGEWYFHDGCHHYMVNPNEKNYSLRLANRDFIDSVIGQEFKQQIHERMSNNVEITGWLEYAFNKMFTEVARLRITKSKKQHRLAINQKQALYNKDDDMLKDSIETTQAEIAQLDAYINEILEAIHDSYGAGIIIKNPWDGYHGEKWEYSLEYPYCL
jgi:hypothetical protein